MKWKTKLPDASLIITKVLPRFMPRKRLDDEEKIPILINEPCIAEATQVVASMFGFGCVFVWDGIGGWIMSILFLLFNIPFIIMQRFNRPRLITANMMLTRRNSYNSEAACKNEVPSEESTAMLCITEAAET